MFLKRETIKSILQIVFGALALGAMFFVGAGYRGPLPSEIDGYSTYSIEGMAIIVFMWLCYKVYGLNKRMEGVESKLNEHVSKDYISPPSLDIDIQKMLAEGNDVTEAVKKIHNIQ